MSTRIICTISALALALTGACGSDSDEAKTRAEALAKKIRAEKRGTAEVIQVAVPVKGGKRIECADLFTDVDALGAVLPDKVELHQLDTRQQLKRQPGTNAICEFIRVGVPPSTEEQAKMAEKTKRLGTLAGDMYCEVRVDCGRPKQLDYESKCRNMSGHQANRDLGIFACVMVSQRAERDAFRFKFFEPDTGCYIDVLGGPSVVDMDIPLACSKFALSQITKSSIEKYKEK